MENAISTTNLNTTTVTNVESSSTTVTKEKAISTLRTLAAAKTDWEQKAYKTSNDLLYGMLQQCYAYYKQMCVNNSEGQAAREGLEAYIAEKGYVFTKSTHNITKIVKCIFGADRRRVSAYSIALRRAHAENKSVMDIAAFIAENGGIEELRLPKSNALTPKEKATQAGATISSQYLGKLKTTELSSKLDASNIGKQMVLVATQGADGEFTINALVLSQAALDAALASYYTSNKTNLSASVQTVVALQPQQAAAAAVEAAVQMLAA